MDQVYAQRRIESVSGHAGTTMAEVQLVAAVGPATLLLRNLAVPWLFPSRNFASGSSRDYVYKFVLDFFITMAPMVLSMTVLAEQVASLVAVLLLCCAALMFFSVCEYLYLHRDRRIDWSALGTTVLPVSPKRFIFVSYFRAHILITTVISILAVDFPIYPRRYAKAETFGYGLMDVGVGIFVVVNSIVGIPPGRLSIASLKSHLCDTITLILLGCVRLVVVSFSGYHTHITEYGLHWNFFFTLATVKVIAAIVSAFLPMRRFSLFLALSLGIGYEYALQNGLKSVIINGIDGSDKRVNIFDANREGIISILGYLTLHFAGVTLGTLLTANVRCQLKQFGYLILQLVVLFIVTYLLLLMAETYLDFPSRRIVNLTYVLWIINLSIGELTMLVVVETVIWFSSAAKLPLFSTGGEKTQPFHLVEPCMWNAINRYPMPYFIAGNITTGLINMCLATLDTTAVEGVAIVLLYSMCITALVYVRYVQKFSF